MLMGRNFDVVSDHVYMFPTLSLHHWNEPALGEWKIKSFNNGKLGDKNGKQIYVDLSITPKCPLFPAFSVRF